MDGPELAHREVDPREPLTVLRAGCGSSHSCAVLGRAPLRPAAMWQRTECQPVAPLPSATDADCSARLAEAAGAGAADNGVVLSWGRGEDGQLGHGDAHERRWVSRRAAAAAWAREVQQCAAAACACPRRAAVGAAHPLSAASHERPGRAGPQRAPVHAQPAHGSCLLLREPTAIFVLLDEGVTSVYCGAEYCIAIAPCQRATYSWGWCAPLLCC